MTNEILKVACYLFVVAIAVAAFVFHVLNRKGRNEEHETNETDAVDSQEEQEPCSENAASVDHEREPDTPACGPIQGLPMKIKFTAEIPCHYKATGTGLGMLTVVGPGVHLGPFNELSFSETVAASLNQAYALGVCDGNLLTEPLDSISSIKDPYRSEVTVNWSAAIGPGVHTVCRTLEDARNLSASLNGAYKRGVVDGYLKDSELCLSPGTEQPEEKFSEPN